MSNYTPGVWQNPGALPPRQFICGYCGHKVGAHMGYHASPNVSNRLVCYIYICPNCSMPVYYDGNSKEFIPRERAGYEVSGILDQTVEKLYSEARDCFSTSAFTAAVMCCRKILMHIAVDKKADKDKGFKYYAGYLFDNHYVPPDAKNWVEFIKNKGNEANHEIRLSEPDEAKTILLFVGMLLKNVYEFPELSEQFEANETVDNSSS